MNLLERDVFFLEKKNKNNYIRQFNKKYEQNALVHNMVERTKKKM